MDKVILNAVMKTGAFKIHWAIFHIQKENFLSVRYLTEKGFLITFKGDECSTIQNESEPYENKHLY